MGLTVNMILNDGLNSWSCFTTLVKQVSLPLESAILYESGIDKKCDKVVAVIAPYTTRIRRVLHRDYTTCSQRIAHLPLVIKKIRNQLSNNQLQSMADFTLVNAAGKNISELFEDIKKIIATFAG